MKYKNKSAFSLIMALGLSLIMVLLVLYIVEYMLPYSKNVKGVENSTKAFYQAETGIEYALLQKTGRSYRSPTQAIDYDNTVTRRGKIIPPPNGGNSEYDKDYNRISSGLPLQVEVGMGAVNILNAVYFSLRVPKIEGNRRKIAGEKWIEWKLFTKGGKVLTAKASSFIDQNDINITGGMKDKAIFSTGSGHEHGEDLGKNSHNIKDFYTANCLGQSCTLKISVLRDLVDKDGGKIPYLEYKIDFGSLVPLHYTVIESKGKSYGFEKRLKVLKMNKTANQATDFAVFLN